VLFAQQKAAAAGDDDGLLLLGWWWRWCWMLDDGGMGGGWVLHWDDVQAGYYCMDRTEMMIRWGCAGKNGICPRVLLLGSK